MDEHDYRKAILELLEKGEGGPLRARRLARLMGVGRDDYGAFRRAYKGLRDSGRLVMGTASARSLPGSPARVTGRIHLHAKGFGFVTPEDASLTEDLFVPPGHTGGAMSGDRVQLRRIDQPRGQGRPRRRVTYEVAAVLERGQSTVVGTLERADGVCFVLPEGKRVTTPVVVRDVLPEASSGSKVVVEVTEFPEADGDLPVGVIVETLGRSGELEAETLAVIRSYGLPTRFSAEALEEARAAAASFDGDDLAGREDLGGLTIVTIDPEDARDFDDAVSLETDADGRSVLGVHIADVSSFVAEGSALDAEAAERGTSVYFPRRVVPMLPEVLSNGVCSLQQGQRRATHSVFVTYDPDGTVVRRRAARASIVSTKRLTYEEAQGILDGRTGGFAPEVARLVEGLGRLARSIEGRRRREGMLHLDLPEVRLLLDEAGEVQGAEPETHLFSHTLIEMLMVEANEAVCALLDGAQLPYVRRVHPEPEDEAFEGLVAFVRAFGLKAPRGRPTREQLQQIVASVEGRPEGYAINLALLRSFQRASYSAEPDEHYALASPAYCHFTSPIRRYPDLLVHRALDRLLEGAGRRRPRGGRDAEEEETAALEAIADHCTTRERVAEAAELELRQVLVLRHLGGRLGETFEGVVTGVADFGLFVQFPRFLVEGLLRLEDLGDDWWEVDTARGRVWGETSGVTYRLGDLLGVRIAAVDVARRHLDLALSEEPRRRRPRRGRGGRSRGTADGPSRKRGPRRGGR